MWLGPLLTGCVLAGTLPDTVPAAPPRALAPSRAAREVHRVDDASTPDAVIRSAAEIGALGGLGTLAAVTASGACELGPGDLTRTWSRGAAQGLGRATWTHAPPACDPSADPTVDECTPQASTAPAEPPPAASPGAEEPTRADEHLAGLLDAPDPPARKRDALGYEGRDVPGSELDATAARRRASASRYRPPSNPAQFHMAARAGYYVASGGERAPAMRMGAAAADVGVHWNYIGVAASVIGGGGTAELRSNESSNGAGMIGGGPSLSLGRLALIGRGILALNAGYDILYVPVSTTTFESDGSAVVRNTRLIPHGPRLRLEMGLLFHQNDNRRLRSGLTMHLGWQLLAGSIGAGMRPANALMVGLGYWLG